MRWAVLFLLFICLIMSCGVIHASDNVVIVLDTSGSMGEYMRGMKSTRLEVAKTALIEVLNKTPTTTRVGLLTFNGWVWELGSVDKSKVVTRIQSMRSSGGTPLYQAMKTGADLLLVEREKEMNIGSYKLIVISDGEATDKWLNQDGMFNDKTIKPGVLKDILSRNIIVDAIGLDMADDHSLRTQINGSYMRGDDSNSLTQAVSKAIAEVGFGNAKDVSDEAFAVIADLPDDLCKSAIVGLTKFDNHPIGTKRPEQLVQSGGTSDPTNPSAAEDDGYSPFSVFLIVIGVVMGLFVFVIIAAAVTE